jgi:uncharacterized protein (DUF927 family)
MFTQHAPALAQQYPIFPCKPDRSAPRTRHGFKDASRDPAQVNEWCRKYPDDLIGVPTGAASGLFVLDVDAKNGKDGFATLAANGWTVPPTRTHRTQHGGAHYLFKMPSGIPLRSTAGTLGDGLDTRADGGFVYWWPANGCEVENPDTLADIPGWLLAALDKGGSRRDTTTPHPVTNSLSPGLTVDNNDLGGGPLGLSQQQIGELLASLDPDMDYQSWLAIGQGLHHETNATQAGLDAWVKWSRGSDKFPGDAELAAKWASFGKRDGGPEVTMRSVARMARHVAQDNLLGEPEQAAAQVSATRFHYGDGVFVAGRDGLTFDTVDSNNEPHSLWICSALNVLAKTRDDRSNAWGRLVRWLDGDGKVHEWALPLAELQGDGLDVRRELARQGLVIAPGKRARDLLASALQVWPVERRARCVERIGWHGDTYVVPTEAIGATDETVVFQNAHALEPAFSTAGTAEQWRDNVARLAAGNSRVVFAVCVAFAGPLLDVAGEDSGGFHLRGASSTGKTTALTVAASVWGNPREYARTWRSTVNGIEGLSSLHNDGLLVLDELGQCDGREAGSIAYLLANGQGKARASRMGTARQAARWRLLFLSAGEIGLTNLMGRAGHRTTAGQEVRLADIPADAGVGLGAFEALHDQPTPAALALALKDAAAKHHGAVGMAWLRFIVANRGKLGDALAAGVRRFVGGVLPPDAAGQVQRVARRFALVGLAGEIATSAGLTGWAKGEALISARKCFAAWLEGFGGAGNSEERAILSQVRAFFEAHGSSRFARCGGQYPDDARIPNRAGFVRDDNSGNREYLVLPETFHREVCQGMDPRLVARTLMTAGWLVPPASGGRNTHLVKVPGIGATRCYIFAGAWAA